MVHWAQRPHWGPKRIKRADCAQIGSFCSKWLIVLKMDHNGLLGLKGLIGLKRVDWNQKGSFCTKGFFGFKKAQRKLLVKLFGWCVHLDTRR